MINVKPRTSPKIAWFLRGKQWQTDDGSGSLDCHMIFSFTSDAKSIEELHMLPSIELCSEVKRKTKTKRSIRNHDGISIAMSLSPVDVWFILCCSALGLASPGDRPVMVRKHWKHVDAIYASTSTRVGLFWMLSDVGVSSSIFIYVSLNQY